MEHPCLGALVVARPRRRREGDQRARRHGRRQARNRARAWSAV